MTAADYWNRAHVAAAALQGLPHAYVHLGADIPRDVLPELARLLGCEVSVLVVRRSTGPLAIESIDAKVLGVQVTGQFARPATMEDARHRGLDSGEALHFETAEALL